MIDTSRAWRESIGKVNRWTCRAEWTRDGKQWVPATVTGCTVTEDQTSQVRWKSDLTLTGVEVGKDALSPHGGRFRIFAGLDRGGSQPEEVQKGLYRIESIDRALTGREVAVQGVSLEQQVMDARFTVPRTMSAAPARQMIEQLIREVLPDAIVAWRVDGSARIRTQTILRDRWGLIDGDSDEVKSIATVLGASVHPNHAGVWEVAAIPSLADPQQWTLSIGEGGSLLQVTESLTRERVYNAVVVNGASTDEGAPTFGPVIVADDDPLSQTYASRSPDEGGFGMKPIFYTSDKFTSERQLEETAKAMLAPRLGLKQELSFEQLYDPAKSAGDVGLLTATPDGEQKVLVDSIDYDLVACTMSAKTRTTATRWAGQVVAIGDEGDGDVEDMGGGDE